MSSSWKWAYNRFVKEGRDDDHIHMVQEALDENGWKRHVGGLTCVHVEWAVRILDDVGADQAIMTCCE